MKNASRGAMAKRNGIEQLAQGLEILKKAEERRRWPEGGAVKSHDIGGRADSGSIWRALGDRKF